MNTESLIKLLRSEIEKLGYQCYSPDLPQSEEKCLAISISQGTHQRSLNRNILYTDIPFSLLIRGTSNDTETRQMADSIFKQLDYKENLNNGNLNIILISCANPNYAFRDENQRIHYNINCTAKVQWKE